MVPDVNGDERGTTKCAHHPFVEKVRGLVVAVVRTAPHKPRILKRLLLRAYRGAGESFEQ